MIIRKSHLPLKSALLKKKSNITNEINDVYLHLQTVSNLRSFKWVQRFKVYNFKTSLYKFNINSFIQYNLLNKWEYINSLFKSVGILISKVKYAYKLNIWEIRFGYYIPFYSKANDSNKLDNSKIHYYEVTDLVSDNKNNTLNKITGLISNIFKSDVKLVLHKLHTRWSDNTIILETLGYYSLKRTLGKLIWRFFAKGKTYNKKPTSDYFHINPGNLTGLFIKVAGRSFRVKLTNRRLTANYEKGRCARKNVLLTDTSRLSRINKYGTFSITTTTAHTI